MHTQHAGIPLKWLKISCSKHVSMQVYTDVNCEKLMVLVKEENEVMMYSTMALWFDDQKCMGLGMFGIVWMAKSCGKCTNGVHLTNLFCHSIDAKTLFVSWTCTHATRTRTHTFHMDNLTCEFSLFYFQIWFFDCLSFLDARSARYSCAFYLSRRPFFRRNI